MIGRSGLLVIIGLCAALLLLSCGEPTEAPRVELPVVVDASGLRSTTTNVGFEVEVTRARLAFGDLDFIVDDESSEASLLRNLSNAIVPTAHAHPGHQHDGQIGGELLGHFAIDWLADDGRDLGDATLIASEYGSANFTYRRGSTDGLSTDDPLVGHTAIISGTASRSGESRDFTVIIDAPEDRQLVGAPFEHSIDEDAAGGLRFRLEIESVFATANLFDDIEFLDLDEPQGNELLIEPDNPAVEDAYNTIRRAFLTHDHFTVEYQE